MAKHLCHALCGRRCPPRHLMCRRCWALVPRTIQLQVWRHYQPGQETGRAQPTAAWVAAAAAAKAAVLQAREGGDNG